MTAKIDWSAERDAFIEAHADSGIKLKAFCEGRGLKHKTAARHIKMKDVRERLSKAQAGQEAKPKKAGLPAKGIAAAEIEPESSRGGECGEQPPSSICGRPLQGKGRRGVCTNKAGHGLEGVTEGPCYIHVNTPPDAPCRSLTPKPNGAPKGNQNARKHGAYSKVLPKEAVDAVADVGIMDLDHHAQLTNAQLYLVADHQKRLVADAQEELQKAIASGSMESIQEANANLSMAVHGPTQTFERLIKANVAMANAKLNQVRFLRESNPLTRAEEVQILHDVLLAADDDPSISAQDICRELGTYGIDPPQWLLNEQAADLKIFHEPPPPEAEAVDSVKQEADYNALLDRKAEERLTMSERVSLMIEADEAKRNGE